MPRADIGPVGTTDGWAEEMSDGTSETGADNGGGVRMGGEELNSNAGGDRKGEGERGRMAAESDCRGSGAVEQASPGSGLVGSYNTESKAASMTIEKLTIIDWPNPDEPFPLKELLLAKPAGFSHLVSRYDGTIDGELIWYASRKDAAVDMLLDAPLEAAPELKDVMDDVASLVDWQERSCQKVGKWKLGGDLFGHFDPVHERDSPIHRRHQLRMFDPAERLLGD